MGGETVTTAKVTLVVDSATADGILFSRGAVRIVPAARIPDSADQLLIEHAGVRAEFPRRNGPPSVQLFPCDLIGPQSGGAPAWNYTVYYEGCPGNPSSWSFTLLSTGGPVQRLSSLAPVPAAQPPGLLPWPSGTPADGDVPVYEGGHLQWGAQTGGGGGAGTVTQVNGKNPDGSGHVTLAAGDVGALAPSGSGAALTGITASQVGADTSGAAAAAQSAAAAYTDAETSRAQAAEALKAPLASPALTGNPTAPTQAAGNNSTRIATTAYADGAVATEASRALAAEALLAPKASPVLTGNPTAPTQAGGDNSTKLATTAFVAAAVAALGLGSAATHAASDFDASGAAAAVTAAIQAATVGPSQTTTNISASSGSWTATKVIALLSVGPFPSGGGYLRLYSNASDQAADASRAEGTAPAVTGILYDFSADTNNADLPNQVTPVTGGTVYYNMSGAGPVPVTWLPVLAQ